MTGESAVNIEKRQAPRLREEFSPQQETRRPPSDSHYVEGQRTDAEAPPIVERMVGAFAMPMGSEAQQEDRQKVK